MFLSGLTTTVFTNRGDEEASDLEICKRATANVHFLQGRRADVLLSKSELDQTSGMPVVHVDSQAGLLKNGDPAKLLEEQLYLLNIYDNLYKLPPTPSPPPAAHPLLDERTLWTPAPESARKPPLVITANRLQVVYFFLPCVEMLSKTTLRVLVETEFALNKRHPSFDWSEFVRIKLSLLRRRLGFWQAWRWYDIYWRRLYGLPNFDRSRMPSLLELWKGLEAVQL